MSRTVTEFRGNNTPVTADREQGLADDDPGTRDPLPPAASGQPRHAHLAADAGPPASGDPLDADAAPQPVGGTGVAGRRTTIVLRYLLGRLAVEQLRRRTWWVWLVPVLGGLLTLIRPRWIGLAVVVLGLLLIAVRTVGLMVLERLSLPRRYRNVEEELRSAIEAGKTSLRVELRAVGLPSQTWQILLFALRLARRSTRADARSRFRQVDVDRVLPRAQLERALRLLDDAAER